MKQVEPPRSQRDPFTPAQQQTWASNKQIQLLLEAFRSEGCNPTAVEVVTIMEPNDGRLMSLTRDGALHAVVIVVDHKVMGYRLFREIDTFTIPGDVEKIMSEAE